MGGRNEAVADARGNGGPEAGVDGSVHGNGEHLEEVQRIDVQRTAGEVHAGGSRGADGV